jgi:hypothetical protein
LVSLNNTILFTTMSVKYFNNTGSSTIRPNIVGFLPETR